MINQLHTLNKLTISNVNYFLNNIRVESSVSVLISFFILFSLGILFFTLDHFDYRLRSPVVNFDTLNLYRSQFELNQILNTVLRIDRSRLLCESKFYAMVTSHWVRILISIAILIITIFTNLH